MKGKFWVVLSVLLALDWGVPRLRLRSRRNRPRMPITNWEILPGKWKLQAGHLRIAQGIGYESDDPNYHFSMGTPIPLMGRTGRRSRN